MDPKTDARGLVTRLMAWAAHPWKTDLSLVDLALTTIFVATVVFFYWRLLSYVHESSIDAA